MTRDNQECSADFISSLKRALAGCALPLTLAGAAHAEGENLLLYDAQSVAGGLAGGCTTSGPPAKLAFFPGAAGLQVQGGTTTHRFLALTTSARFAALWDAA